jgi:elongation factor G
MGQTPAGSTGAAPGTRAEGPRRSRLIALTGPYLSGKSTLLEAILARTGAVTRQGTIADRNTVADASPEARAHGMSVELTFADTTFLNDPFTFVDCPGSIEFQTESHAALAACDAAIVVCEPDEKRVPALQVILKSLEDRGIPHVLFLNKIDSFAARVRDIIPMLQPASGKPLVLRQIPIWKDGVATGFVDLASERAYLYQPHAESRRIDLPADLRAREHEARFQMLEKVADFDDDLMAQLLADEVPAPERVYGDLTRELQDGLICPVFLGSAANGNGIVRLLKALRHEAPFVDQTAKRLGLDRATSAVQVIKTIHTPHGGKLSVARVLAGEVSDSTVLTGKSQDERVSGVMSLLGETTRKRGPALPGDTVALGRLERIGTGETLSANRGGIMQVAPVTAPPPVYGFAIELKDRKDEVKLSAALTKLREEDPSLSLQHAKDTHQMVLWGQGEMHLRVALERLQRKYGIDATARKRQVPYRETIRGHTEVRGRHKKQSGGHGQFGDVLVSIAPRSRGEGFKFEEKIHGGTVPKQYIPSVEIGVAEYLQKGPLGFPVVDVAVTLLDGSYHSVDSSDMAFRQAGRLAMSEGLPKCQPVLLEPIMAVEIAVPSEATARVNAIVAQRRGQILGFDTRPGWTGWDIVQAHLPESEMADLIVEVRSATAGVGTYTATFHHLAELTGRLAEQVVQATAFA